MAYKYIPFFGGQTKLLINKNAEEFKVKPGELTRWYVINAGPRGNVAFNFAGGPINENRSSDSSSNISDLSNTRSKIFQSKIVNGKGSFLLSYFNSPEGYNGTYFGNDHDLGRVLSGAGFVVLATNNSTSEGHTNGT
jgi:hypothetical protein